MSGDLRRATRRPVSFLHTMRAVAWSFFGVRRSVDHARDVEKLNPVHVVIAGILGAIVFVTALVLIVRWVVGSASGG